jgi:Pvc16 N-terminal domain
MIGKSLKQIVDGLNNYLGAIYNPGLPGYENEYAVIKHLKKDSFDANGSKKIAVNLINIEEDTVYKNQLNPLPPNSGQLTHAMPGIAAMRIKMYVLFAFQPGDDSEKYAEALTLLTHTLRYFQSTPYQQITINGAGGVQQFNLEINYHNISLEDSHNMWSNLGGEQKPYAMYQIQMLEIVPEAPAPSVPVIQQIPVTIV